MIRSAFLVLALSLVACSPSVLSMHARTATGIDSALRVDARAFDARTRALVRQGYEDTCSAIPADERPACASGVVERVVERLAPWQRAHNALVGAHRVYVASVLAASDGKVEVSDVVGALDALLALARALVEAAGAEGVLVDLFPDRSQGERAMRSLGYSVDDYRPEVTP